MGLPQGGGDRLSHKHQAWWWGRKEQRGDAVEGPGRIGMGDKEAATAQLDPSPQDGHRPRECKARGSQQVAGARREGEKMQVKKQRQRPTWVTPPRGFAEKAWAQRRSVEVGHVHGTIREPEKPVVQEVGGGQGSQEKDP